MVEYTYVNGWYYGDNKGIPETPEGYEYLKMMRDVKLGIATIVTLESTFDALEAAKKIKKAEINDKTDQLIEAGITHNSIDFKINIEKEITALGLNSARMAGADMAGKKFRAKDQTYTFVDTADFDAWFNTAFARVESLLVSGSELKDQVDAAADQAALDAIVDNRV